MGVAHAGCSWGCARGCSFTHPHVSSGFCTCTIGGICPYKASLVCEQRRLHKYCTCKAPLCSAQAAFAPPGPLSSLNSPPNSPFQWVPPLNSPFAPLSLQFAPQIPPRAAHCFKPKAFKAESITQKAQKPPTFGDKITQRVNLFSHLCAVSGSPHTW